MKRLTFFAVASVFTICNSAVLQAAMISLDTAGADPDITSPAFTFTTDAGGSFNATFRNVSAPPVDFLTLTLTAPFTEAFYNSPGGPKNGGSSCDGGTAFTDCNVGFSSNNFNVVFYFFGTDASHPGLPFGGEINLRATAFEPNQTIGAVATFTPADVTGTVPEPGAFGLVMTGFLLTGLAVGGKKFLKLRIRS